MNDKTPLPMHPTALTLEVDEDRFAIVAQHSTGKWEILGGLRRDWDTEIIPEEREPADEDGTLGKLIKEAEEVRKDTYHWTLISGFMFTTAEQAEILAVVE